MVTALVVSDSPSSMVESTENQNRKKPSGFPDGLLIQNLVELALFSGESAHALDNFIATREGLAIGELFFDFGHFQ